MSRENGLRVIKALYRFHPIQRAQIRNSVQNLGASALAVYEGVEMPYQVESHLRVIEGEPDGNGRTYLDAPQILEDLDAFDGAPFTRVDLISTEDLVDGWTWIMDHLDEAATETAQLMAADEALMDAFEGEDLDPLEAILRGSK